MTEHLADIAERLDSAQASATAVPQLETPLNLDDAYAVQRLSLARRYQRGERRVGIKMGFTSRAKMAQMGIDEMIWGRLTDAMQVEDGGEVGHARFVHPRVEPELAFLLGEAPDGGPITSINIAACVVAVAPGCQHQADPAFTIPDRAYAWTAICW